MTKLLVNTPQDFQEVISVGEGGGYFELARVLWDERKDGPLPASVQVGGMVRQGNQLVLDPAKLAAHQAAQAARDQAKAQAEAEKLARRNRLRNDVAAANSVPALRALIQDIVVELGL